MNNNTDEVEAHVWLDAEPAIDEEGNVRLLVTKIYPQIKVSHGYSSFQGGYTAIPAGQLLVRFPVLAGENDGQLHAQDFSALLSSMVSVLRDGVSAFVNINLESQREASQKFQAMKEEGDEIG